MREEYDFSKGERGKFYREEATFILPVYLEADVGNFMSRLAEAEGVTLQEMVNKWLRASIRLAQSEQDVIEPTKDNR